MMSDSEAPWVWNSAPTYNKDVPLAAYAGAPDAAERESEVERGKERVRERQRTKREKESVCVCVLERQKK